MIDPSTAVYQAATTAEIYLDRAFTMVAGYLPEDMPTEAILRDFQPLLAAMITAMAQDYDSYARERCAQK